MPRPGVLFQVTAMPLQNPSHPNRTSPVWPRSINAEPFHLFWNPQAHRQFKKTPISRSDFRLVGRKGFVQAFELRKIEALSFVVWRFALGCTLGGGLAVTMRSAWKRSWQSLISLCSNERVIAGRGTQHFSHGCNSATGVYGRRMCQRVKFETKIALRRCSARGLVLRCGSFLISLVLACFCMFAVPGASTE